MTSLDLQSGAKRSPVRQEHAAVARDKSARAERFRIAAELHDGILQELTAADFALKVLLDAAEPGAKPAIERARGILREQHGLLRHYVTSLRDGPDPPGAETGAKIATVVIADDHPIVLKGLSALIDGDADFRVVATCADGALALEAIGASAPDIAVLDLNMPGRSGLEVLQQLRERALPTRAVILAASASDAEIYDLLAAGAAGLVFKESATESLLHCLHVVTAGGRWLPVERTDAAALREATRRKVWKELSLLLTTREMEIVQLVLSGESNKNLAFRLKVSEGTAKVHLHNIFRKLGVGSRSELLSLAGGQAGKGNDHPHG